MESRLISPVPMASHKWRSMIRSTERKMMTMTMMMMMVVVVTVTMMRPTMMSSHFSHMAYPFWHLLTKGEC